MNKNLKPYWKSEKRPYLSRWLIVPKILLVIELRLTGWSFLAVDFSLTFLETGTTKETFYQSGKEDSFRHILKRSTNMYESSGPQFFRTTFEMQSGLDALKESKSVKRFLTIVEVSFRFVLEWKSGREIPGSSRLEISANNWAIWVFFFGLGFYRWFALQNLFSSVWDLGLFLSLSS